MLKPFHFPSSLLAGNIFSGMDVYPFYTSTKPNGTYQFTKFACPAGGGFHLDDYSTASYGGLNVQECEFWGGTNVLGGTSGTTLLLDNNLFARSCIGAAGSGSLSFSNNLVWGTASARLNPSSGTVWYAFNNDFDSTTIGSSTLTNGYNAYLSSSGRLYPANPYDIVSSGTLAYKSGWLGTFYQPTTSLLINKGSATADQVGLYHYTTQTNQVPETNSVVDIGYHYVATDAYGNPLETLWLGVPDYLADTNGELAAWEMEYFGHTGLDPAALDTGGNTLLYDYTSAIVPANVIQFSIETTNNYVSAANAGVQLDITAGVPSYYAVFVGSSGTTNWLAFTTTNLTVNVGATDGVYDMNVVLKGCATNATQTWNDYSITVDRVAPVIVITNPIINAASNNAVVIEPYVQLQGFANEPLMSLSYDISNATGIATNLDAFVTDQAFDTNKFDFSTNWFQAYDVPLTNGVNNITLRLTDRAGNMTTTNFNVTLDYSGATNPVVSLTWPTNGMELCGGSFTLRGMVDDPCASVSATITDTNGDVTTIAGEVERSGVLWVENLPLAEGTNLLTLWVTNSAGLTNAASISVVKSDMTLMVTNISGDLWQPPVNVSGFVSDTTAAIYVNGLQGTNYGNGTWEVDNVPVSASGVASFDVDAIPGGGGDPAINTNVDKPAEIIMVGYQEAETEQGQEGFPWWNVAMHMGYTNQPYAGADGQWLSPYHGYEDLAVANDLDGLIEFEDVYNWSPTDDSVLETSGGTPTYYDPIPGSWEWTPPPIPGQDQTWGCSSCGPSYESAWMTHYFANNVRYHYDLGGGGTEDLAVTARTWMKLYTGGKAGVNLQNLFCINAGATEYGRPPMDYEPPFYPWWSTPSWDVADKTSIRVLGKYLGADGNLWVTLPDNASLDLFIAAPPRHYDAWAGVQKYKLNITDNGAPLDPDTVNVTNCVGQLVTFNLAWSPATPPIVNMAGQWNLPGKFVNEILTPDPLESVASSTYDVNNTLLQNTNQTSCWFYDKPGGKVVVGLNLLFNNGQSASVAADGSFTVYRPSVNTASFNPFTSLLGFFWDGRTLQADMKWNVRINSDWPGGIGIVQLVNGAYVANGEVTKSTGGAWWLDGNSDFYNAPRTYDASSYDNSRVEIFDTPSAAPPPWVIWPIHPDVQMQASYQDYIQFKPGSITDPNNIWVTIGTNTWWFYGHATSDAGIIESNIPPATVPVDSDQFPSWIEFWPE